MATSNVPIPLSTTELQQFVIPGARAKGKPLGGGAYGTVEEYDVNGVPCAGKRIYDVLVQSGVGDVVRRYVEECKLMAKLRHPNIVQFLGVCFPPESTLPVLIMERLTTDLDSLLENPPNIPLSLRMSFLTDVVRGLAYLHGHRPPIIHRDLSARNVLLNSNLVAKISDLGNSHIVNLSPVEVTKLSFTPGTLVYMPPEMSEGSPCYGASLDVFSFGHLGLFLTTQVFPNDLLPHTYPDPSNPKHLVARSEVERRERYFTELHQQLGEDHSIVRMVKECLNNDPHQRPTSEQLVSRLEKMSHEVQSPQDHTAKLELMGQLRQIEGLDSINIEKEQCQEESTGLVRTQPWKNHPFFDPANTVKISVRQCANIPIATSNAQAVIIKGKVYVRGLLCDVFIYNIVDDSWSSIKSSTSFAALACYNEHLVLAGGWIFPVQVTNQVWVLGEDDCWQQPIPPMPTPRKQASAVGYGQHLIVAGGESSTGDVLDTVEVYSGQQWMIADPMPCGYLEMKSAVLNGTWYLTGGYKGFGIFSPNSDNSVISVNLHSLTARTILKQGDDFSPWNRLTDAPNQLMAVATTGGGLFAFGGYAWRNRSYAYMYFPPTKSWVSIGKLPHYVVSTCAVTLPSDEVMLCGGITSNATELDTVCAVNVWNYIT